jgi:hypothetical protein
VIIIASNPEGQHLTCGQALGRMGGYDDELLQLRVCLSYGVCRECKVDGNERIYRENCIAELARGGNDNEQMTQRANAYGTKRNVRTKINHWG